MHKLHNYLKTVKIAIAVLLRRDISLTLISIYTTTSDGDIPVTLLTRAILLYSKDFDFCDLKLRNFAKFMAFQTDNGSCSSSSSSSFYFWFVKSINYKENNSKPEKGHGNKTIFVEICTHCKG